MNGRRRILRPDERQLWSAVARSVAPLHPAKLSRLEPEEPHPPVPNTPPGPPSPGTVPVRPPSPKPALPPLAPLERGTLRALARGRQDLDAVLDLHGMRQDEAHAALIGFLRRSQSAGHKVVLVVTGKGSLSAGMWGLGERGVLRRLVPEWLHLPQLRPVVLGFEPAARHQGGDGALYVRLRRSRFSA